MTARASTASAAVTQDRRAALEAFYRRERPWLERHVAARVFGVPGALVEDACQFEWTQLAAHPEVTLDESGFAWRALTARREVWRLARIDRAPAPLADPGETATEVSTPHRGPGQHQHGRLLTSTDREQLERAPRRTTSTAMEAR